MLVHDHVVTDYLCNLKCGYCPCEVTLMRRRGELLRFAGTNSLPAHLESVGSFVERNRQILAEARNHVDAPILKVSGGELFLVPEFFSLLPELTAAYTVVQLLTNGTLLSSDLCGELGQYSNVHLQVSLDGHTIAMNQARFTNAEILRRITDGIVTAASAGISLEINTVVTKHNVDSIGEFLLWIARIVRSPVTVNLFPVRGSPDLRVSQDQANVLRETMTKIGDIVKDVLPPKAYLESLLDFLSYPTRSTGCHVPSAVLATTGHGDLEACTCGPVKHLGSVLNGGQSRYAAIGIDPSYVDVLNSETSPKCCEDCFTHYDVINLYFRGEIADWELQRLPFFAPTQVMRRIRMLKGLQHDTTTHHILRRV